MTPGPLLQRGDDGERSQVHERVGDAVEQQRLDPVIAAERVTGPGRQADEHVAGVRDGAVRQHPLDVVLGQGHQVAERHRQRREDDHHGHPLVRQRAEGLDEEAQDEREGADLGADRQVAGDRGRRSLVRVGRPVVERDRRDLEGDPGGQEREAHRQAGRQRMRPGDDRGQFVGDDRDPGGTGQAPDEGEPEQEDGRTERAEQEVLDGAFGRIRVGLVEARQQVAGQDHQLEAEEQQQEVRRGRDEHRAGHREDEDRCEFRDRQPARDQVVRSEQDRHHDDRDEQEVEEGGQRVDSVGAAEGLAGHGADGDRRGVP